MASEPAQYLVKHLPAAIQQFRELDAKAKASDIRGVLHDAMLQTMQRLAKDPLGSGDPECRTRKKNGMYCHTVVPPIVVNYVVYEDEKAVLIWKIKPVPGSLLDRE